MIRRTLDGRRLTEIANHPDVRPWLGGGVTPLDLAVHVSNPKHVCLESANGGFLVLQQAPTVYAVHSLFLPDGRGGEAADAMRDGLAYLFTRTPCLELVTNVPESNPAAMALARAAGFTDRFRRHHAWPDLGGPTTVRTLGLTLFAWAMRADETLQAGRMFHETLTRLVADRGGALPAHSDDGDAHDHAAGATALMVTHGLPYKAAQFYHGWAASAGYDPIAVLSDSPIVLDLGAGVIIECDGPSMTVLRCPVAVEEAVVCLQE